MHNVKINQFNDSLQDRVLRDVWAYYSSRKSNRRLTEKEVETINEQVLRHETVATIRTRITANTYHALIVKLNSIKEIITALNDLQDALDNVCNTWEHNEHMNDLVTAYPFNESLDDLQATMKEWTEKVTDELLKK